MSSMIHEEAQAAVLRDKATQLRIDCVRATTEAGSGHPTTCASAAEIVAVLFYAVMRHDPRNPQSPANDIFVLSKGHAAPLLYAAWAEAGAFPREQLLTLRTLESDFEGHPTPRLRFVDVATGSLGQGLSVGTGIALAAQRLDRTEQRVYVLLGDGESAEGAVWEAAQWAARHRLNNLCATIDINRLGQSEPTMLQHDLETYRARWEAFGWRAIPVDGHSVPDLLAAYAAARETAHRPTVVLARTLKGKGLAGIEDQPDWHGKALDPPTAARVLADLERQRTQAGDGWQPRLPARSTPVAHRVADVPAAIPPYQLGGKPVAPRKAFGDSLAAVAAQDPRLVVLDGDVKNSTYTEVVEQRVPDRFFQGYIAEQNLLGLAMGLAARGKVPFAVTFACFLTRAYDFIRMAAISGLNLKLAGTHVGVAIGEDGPSQMGLEDLAMLCAEPNFTCLYPADATSAWQATHLLARHPGPGYLRLGRGPAPILYPPEERFAVGQCKVLRSSAHDRALIVAGGITVFEALTAYEQLQQHGIAVRVIDVFSVQPIDRETLRASARAANGVVITVEDHYAHGGLGDAVLAALAFDRVRLAKLAVQSIPHSGKAAALLERFGISARHIVEAVRNTLQREAA